MSTTIAPFSFYDPADHVILRATRRTRRSFGGRPGSRRGPYARPRWCQQRIQTTPTLIVYGAAGGGGSHRASRMTSIDRSDCPRLRSRS